MTPFINSVKNVSIDSTPIRLADSSTVRSTHSGQSVIPIGVKALVRTLVVPSLHEPLLRLTASRPAPDSIKSVPPSLPPTSTPETPSIPTLPLSSITPNISDSPAPSSSQTPQIAPSSIPR
ncbi:hypothetical protein PCASD_02403 [Puccinia coronata f. sp. avenae]|uniref:Uncharacterized protein n=1 Tax=Puccinia coronata f. sp. avenae TaxID=200324 RepID=A0A2N5VM38_9BASI|nr:hypothetical protein PCASD_02403 [Puccinia coronata f. sp. avenae]